MTMHLILNTENKQYIKKQNTETIDLNLIQYTDNLMQAQIYEDKHEAEINISILNTLAGKHFALYQPFTDYKSEAEYFEGNKDKDEYLNWYQYDINRYPHPSVTVDLIALRFNTAVNKLQLLLIQRKHWPYKNMWAMPGGFVDKNETINHAVIRETKEETNVDLSSEIIIRRPAVSKADRDPRTWVITNPNIVLFKNGTDFNSVSAGDDAGNTQWVDVALKDGKLQIDRPLAFDHYDIIQRALQYLTTDFNSVKLPRLITLLPHELTLNQLKTLYSQLDSKYTDINNSNLYRLNKKYLQQTSDYKSGEVGRPERIYVYRDKDVTKFN